MDRRRLAALALVGALAVLAGCGGFLGSDGPARTATPGPAQPAPIYEPPLDGQRVVAVHADVLEANGTVRYVRNDTLRYRGGDRLLVTNVSATLDLSGDRLVAHRNVSLQGEQAVYAGGSSTYVRRGSGGEATYEAAPAETANASQYARPPLGRYLDGLSFTYIGSAEENGTWVHTYVVEGADDVSDGFSFGPLDGANVTGANATLRVTDAGRIRTLQITAAGTGRGGVELVRTLRVRYRDAGSATVSEPSWVSTARSRAE